MKVRAMVPNEASDRWNIHPEPGWIGVFTRGEVPGAWPNGTKVIKIKADDEAEGGIGKIGTVLGSIGSRKDGFGYFIEWEQTPKIAVFVSDWKISAAIARYPHK